MELKLIERKIESLGYGARSGETIIEKYECPCGKGVVTYEKDDIIGFRHSDTSCNCTECVEKYDFNRGNAREI